MSPVIVQELAICTLEAVFLFKDLCVFWKAGSREWEGREGVRNEKCL